MSSSTNPEDVAAEMARLRLERESNETNNLRSALRSLETVIQHARDKMNLQEDEYRAVGLRFYQAVPLTSRVSEVEDVEWPELEAFKASPSPGFISSSFYFPAYWEKMLDLTGKAIEASEARAPLPPLEKLQTQYQTARQIVDEIITLLNQMSSQINHLRESVENLIDEEDPDGVWFWFTHDMAGARRMYLGRLGSPAQRTQMLMDMQSEPEWEHFEAWVGTWPKVRRLVQSGVPLTVAAEKIFFEVHD